LLLSSFAVATVTVDPTKNLGGDSHDASNPEHDDEPEIAIVTTTITFTNDDPVNDIDVTYNGVTKNIQKFNIKDDGTFSFDDQDKIRNALENDEHLLVVELKSDGTIINKNDIITVPANDGTIDITLKTMIPASLDAVNDLSGEEIEESAFDVMDLNFEAETEPLNVKINMQRENQLFIDDFDSRVNGKSDESNIKDKDDIQDLSPGDLVELIVKVENRFDDKEELDIEDIDLEVVCDPDDDIDFDDDSIDIGDISPEDDSTDEFKIDIEEDAEDDDLKCYLRVKGEDENGALHGESIEFTMEIERESHDVVIKNIKLNPSSLTCDDTILQLTVDIINLGKSNEDEVAVEVTSKTLSFMERLSNMELDEDDATSETFSIQVNPKELAEGSYAFQVQTFYDNVKVSNTDIITIENTCTIFSGPSDDDEPTFDFKDVVTLKESTIEASAGSTSSIEIVLTNTESKSIDYQISLENLEEFAESISTKTVHLNPGQSSTVFLNIKAKEDAEQGKYTATVKVKNANTGETVQTETFTVDLTSGKKQAIGFDFAGDYSKPLMILINVVLVILAILFIKLIFTAGGRKQKVPIKTEKVKMADFEPAPKRRKR